MKKLLIFLITFLSSLKLMSQEGTLLNINGASINSLIEISSKVLNKNIVLTEQIDGNIDFISQKAVSNSELLEVLKSVLYAKGYKLVEYENLFKIVKKDNNFIIENATTEIVALNNAEVKDVIPILKSIFDNIVYRADEIKPFIAQDNQNNSVIINAQQKQMNEIKKLIQNLDQHQMQVYVEAKIIELSENKTKDLGLRYGLSAVNVASNNIFTLGTNLGGVVNALDSATSSLFSIPLNTLNSAIALGATLNLLKLNQAIDIVSEPSVLCVNNKESTIYVGETKSFQTALSVTDGGNTNSSFQREDIGLTLKVKPRISTQNRVILEIETILEDARELQLNQINPDTTKKEIKTTAIVSNAESVILGGLIKNKNDVYNSKTPLLGDIPVVGELFNYNKEINDKVNLVVIVTPYIIPKSKDLTFIREQLSKLKQLEEEYTIKLEEKLENNIEDNINFKNEYVKNKLDAHSNHENILRGASW